MAASGPSRESTPATRHVGFDTFDETLRQFAPGSGDAIRGGGDGERIGYPLGECLDPAQHQVPRDANLGRERLPVFSADQ
jgi:hypothetical protein